MRQRVFAFVDRARSPRSSVQARDRARHARLDRALSLRLDLGPVSDSTGWPRADSGSPCGGRSAAGPRRDRRRLATQATLRHRAIARARWPARSPNTGPTADGCCEFAGLDPEHALVRWGNFDRTVLLPSTVFEPDEHGRSYRFRPNMRSIWVRNFPMKGPVKAYFQVPDHARAARDRQGDRRVRSSTARPRRPIPGACAGPSPT